ncbi:MAG TPA: carbohydrate binding domain-containing protein [Polyangiaceae bacterium]|nr:carbohydrate binding domain-containing protein [Polyangiaceae bacterium]
MRRRAASAALAGFGFLATALGACISKTDPTAPDPHLPAARACPAAVGMISDGESANKTNFIQGRGGYWYTFLDTKDNGGSDIWPLSGQLGGTFEMSDGGAAGTAHSARMKGTIGGGDIVYAGMGLNFVDPKGTYDASRFGGIAFWAKKNGGSTNHVRLKVPDAQTDPDGKLCKQCFNDHGMTLELYDQWTHYVVPFKAMHQEDWGPKDDGIDPSRIYGVQFQVNEKNAVFDISVDQIEFTGCG